jgi:hypothetical protein
LFRRLGGTTGIAFALLGLGDVLYREGDYSRAEAALHESLAHYHEAGYKLYAAGCIAILALIATAQGKMERGVRLLAAASAMREAVGAPWSSSDRGAGSQVQPVMRATLGEAGFAAAWDAGAAMDLEQIATYVSHEAGES